ncbi:MAG: CPBP family intramembrane metalloprotease [Verrucomicrobia bacterium]|nr:CPBP family intramembrane metalloprotease [Verrucomicrobiota bacterium]
MHSVSATEKGGRPTMKDENNSPDAARRRSCYLAAGIAISAFSLLFLRLIPFFWIQLAVSVLVLCGLALVLERKHMLAALRDAGGRNLIVDVALGLASASVLYVVFMVGNVAARILFPFGGSEIESVYGFGSATSRLAIGLLLLLVVGPGEEFFWRGYVQRRLASEFGLPGMALSVLAYGGAHVVTFNLTLILAAFVCGGFWALMYHFFHSLRANMISHAAWAVAIFVLFPMA